MINNIQDEISELSREELEQFSYDMLRQQEALHRLVRLIPPCPYHGELCTSHAADWIQEQKTKNC